MAHACMIKRPRTHLTANARLPVPYPASHDVVKYDDRDYVDDDRRHNQNKHKLDMWVGQQRLCGGIRTKSADSITCKSF